MFSSSGAIFAFSESIGDAIRPEIKIGMLHVLMIRTKAFCFSISSRRLIVKQIT